MLPSVVAEAGRRHGDRAVFVAPAGWSVSYRELDRLTDETAAGLARAGVREGSAVAVMLDAAPDFMVVYLALAKLGALTGGINRRLAAPERSLLLTTFAPDLVVADPALTEGVAFAGPSVELPAADGPDSLGAGIRVRDGTPPPLDDVPDREVAVVFTSGSTGTPRGAVFANRQLRAIAEMDTGGRWGGGAASLASTEPVHIGAMTKLPWYLMAGTTLHMMWRWRAADALRIVAEERIASVGGISAQIGLMLRDPSFDTYDLSCVQVVVAGGGPSSPALVREAQERFGARYSNRYSSTESGGLGTLTDHLSDPDAIAHTVGRPRPGIDLEIRTDDGRVAAPGEVGEVCLRSPAVMSGYRRDEQATAEVLVDGWLRTGDLGSVGEDGCLRLAGRRKEMYVRGGYNVFPAEVEAVLGEHPSVAQVAVVPRADHVMGEIGVAFVVPADPARPPALADLRDFAARRLAAFKLPEDLRTVDALPLNATHKVDRRRLAAELEASRRDG